MGMGKIPSLAKLVGCKVEDVRPVQWDNCVWTAGGAEYLVLTEREANRRARAAIRDSLWAFKPEWLESYINGNRKATIAALQAMQEKCCEDCNELVYLLVRSRFGEVVQGAIDADGRGHFLANYDGEEREAGDYFVYHL